MAKQIRIEHVYKVFGDSPKAALELIAQGKGRKRHLGLSDEAIVKGLVEKHLRFTGSTVALAIMDDWATHRKHFVKVFPHEYKRALTDMYAESIKSKSASREAVAK